MFKIYKQQKADSLYFTVDLETIIEILIENEIISSEELQFKQKSIYKRSITTDKMRKKQLEFITKLLEDK